MRRTKALLTLFLFLIISVIPFGNVKGHSVELDPESLISMPMMIYGGSGTITIANSVSNYTLYFQGVQIPSTVYSEIEKTQSDGEKDLDILKKACTALEPEIDNLKTNFDTASTAYQTGITNNVSETELEALKTAYETAKSNYQAKVTEYNNKVTEYNNKVNEVNGKIKELTPTYVESNWTQTTDNKISIDVTQFSGEHPYVVWVKLVTSSGTYYDEGIYKMVGSKPTDVSVKSVTLDKTTLSINEGSSYTLTATINPSDATNKSLIWTSDNEKVATVSNGKVSAVSEGTATITVTTVDGNYSATCKVTVNKVAQTPEKTDNKEDETKSDNNKSDDTTVPTGELPKTGVTTYIAIFIIISLSIIGIISYKKIKYYNFK